MAEKGESVANDAELVARSLEGDGAGFEEIVRRYGKAVYNLIRRWVGNGEDSKDVFQDTLLSAFRSLDRFDSSKPFLPWILGIAANRCREETRRRRCAPVSSEGGPEKADSSPRPEDAVERKELAAMVEKAVSGLDEAHKSVFLLRIYSGLTYAQIGAVLNISEGTAKSRMHYAVSSVRACLKS